MECRQLLILHSELTQNVATEITINAHLVHIDLPPTEEGMHIAQHLYMCHRLYKVDCTQLQRKLMIVSEMALLTTLT